MTNLTSDQVDAITHAWLDLCASKEHFESEEQFTGVGADELAVACRDSVEELEKTFPFLLDVMDDKLDQWQKENPEFTAQFDINGDLIDDGEV
tara:strand:- start:265 stop:543 length:279 start_codon:yes stop_codon:yes gene_type:complete